jgi:hypothetical protein
MGGLVAEAEQIIRRHIGEYKEEMGHLQDLVINIKTFYVFCSDTTNLIPFANTGWEDK